MREILTGQVSEVTYYTQTYFTQKPKRLLRKQQTILRGYFFAAPATSRSRNVETRLSRVWTFRLNDVGLRISPSHKTADHTCFVVCITRINYTTDE